MELEKRVHPYDDDIYIYVANDDEEIGVSVHLIQDWNDKDKWEVTVDLPHQCDEWLIASGPVEAIDEVRNELAVHIKDLQSALVYLSSDHYKEFVKTHTGKEATDGTETTPGGSPPGAP